MLCACHVDGVGFFQSCDKGEIGRLVAEGFAAHYGFIPTESEQNSWANSLVALSLVLRQAYIHDVDLFLEVQMPLSSARCDAIISGLDEMGLPCFVVVELKQWQHVSEFAIRDTLSLGGRPVLHPSVQTRSYVQYLKHYHSTFSSDGFRLAGCAYLHGITAAKDERLLVSENAFDSAPREYPVFTGLGIERFIEYLRQRVGRGRFVDLKSRLLDGRIEPSTKLLDVVDAAVQSYFEWKLLDEQLLAYNEIVSLVESTRHDGDERHLVAVRGGPGTGKSVLAIQLLAYGARQHWRIAHATGSKAFRTVLQAKTQSFADQFLRTIYNVRKKSELPVKEIFATFRDIANVGSKARDTFDLVVGDEGHRIWDFRRNVRTYQQESVVPLIEEIIQSSRVTAMFLDDNQGVRANEIGSVQYLKEQADRLGIKFHLVDLNVQFRCSGSKSYVDWLENVLGYPSMMSTAWRKFEGYDFRIFNSPDAMQQHLRLLAQDGERCRLVAGFCWKWSKPRPDGSLAADVAHPRFGRWSAPWIEKTDRYADPMSHRYYLWANDEAYFDQVGSIYSIQGFEFDYVGVIFGDDLVYRREEWFADLSRNRDNQFLEDIRRRRATGEGVDENAQLRNIYRVLLSRGMKGTFVYFLDEESRRRFVELLA